MSYIRLYRMTARAGAGAELRAALEKLGRLVEPLDGCTGIELLCDTKVPEQFVFLERWSSAEAHQEGGKQLGKDAFAQVMNLLASSPDAMGLVPA